METLLGSAGVGSFTGVGKQCAFGFSKQQDGRYALAPELELIIFWPFPFKELMWNLITQVNKDILSDQITVFDPSNGKRRRLILFMVYALVYPSIGSNLVTLDTLSPWYDSICTHTCYNFLSNNLLR